jgi:hypothetical protein
MKTKNQSNVERRAEFASELIEKLSALVLKEDVVVEQIKPKEEPKRVEKTSFESKPQLKASPFFNISEEMIEKYREPDADFERQMQYKPKYEPKYKDYTKPDNDSKCSSCFGFLSKPYKGRF